MSNNSDCAGCYESPCTCKAAKKKTSRSKPASRTAKADAHSATDEPVLCYVCGPWAYFTTRPLKDQWGDDWDDAPYEHSAGSPYTFHDHDRQAGREPWEIVKIVFDGRFSTPADLAWGNCPYSVQRINAGYVPWLVAEPDAVLPAGAEPVVIPAGTTVSEFVRLIRAGGGTVYLPA